MPQFLSWGVLLALGSSGMQGGRHPPKEATRRRLASGAAAPPAHGRGAAVQPAPSSTLICTYHVRQACAPHDASPSKQHSMPCTRTCPPPFPHSCPGPHALCAKPCREHHPAGAVADLVRAAPVSGEAQQRACPCCRRACMCLPTCTHACERWTHGGGGGMGATWHGSLHIISAPVAVVPVMPAEG